MSHQINFDDSDEGKEVVDADGDTVGRVVSVEHGTAHVDPDPGITETVMSKLGWGDSDEETYILQEANVAEITDDEVRLDHL
ncbi:PRC-barrel domain containing protein [Halobium palmae]|uniref:PRC-barrel domain containing protein n=1 Tax=Halobium palmae TaxID=1776492 RepID=A0ABD5S2V9_9EURY